MEYAEGGELFDKLVPDIGMPEAQAKFYFKQLVNGVAYLHKKFIGHRDLKPENLLLTRGTALVIFLASLTPIFTFFNYPFKNMIPIAMRLGR